jgi:hypothetical protein
VSLAINQTDPFVKKEFLTEWQAYGAVEVAEQNQLGSGVQAQIKQLADGKVM